MTYVWTVLLIKSNPYVFSLNLLMSVLLSMSEFKEKPTYSVLNPCSFEILSAIGINSGGILLKVKSY